jgi:hypothetical protein
MSGLTKTELWASYCEEHAQGRYISSFWKLLPAIDQQDVSDFFELLSGGSESQRAAAVHALVVLYSHQDKCLFGQIEKVRTLLPHLRAAAADGYPLGKQCHGAVFVWFGLDQESASEFINEWVDQNEIAEATAQQVMLHLSFGNQESVARLRRIAESNSHIKPVANTIFVLERTAPDWPEKLKEYGRQWKERRDCRTLLHLTNQLIDRRPREDAYISQVLDVMGPPDGLVDRCYTYLTKPEFQGSLFLETDHNGKIVGWKLDNC